MLSRAPSCAATAATMRSGQPLARRSAAAPHAAGRRGTAQLQAWASAPLSGSRQPPQPVLQQHALHNVAVVPLVPQEPAAQAAVDNLWCQPRLLLAGLLVMAALALAAAWHIFALTAKTHVEVLCKQGKQVRGGLAAGFPTCDSELVLAAIMRLLSLVVGMHSIAACWAIALTAAPLAAVAPPLPLVQLAKIVVEQKLKYLQLRASITDLATLIGLCSVACLLFGYTAGLLGPSHAAHSLLVAAANTTAGVKELLIQSLLAAQFFGAFQAWRFSKAAARCLAEAVQRVAELNSYSRP